MRAVTAALLAAALLAAAAAPASASSQPRALIAFLPPPSGGRAALLEELAARGLAVGLVSPTLGGYSPEQMAIDIGQGARISTRAYKSKVPPLALAGNRIAGWEAELHRARAAPGDIRPGLLATTIERAGGRVAYVGMDGADRTQALAAADSRGRIGAVSIGPAATAAGRALALWQPGSLVVARLPGAAALDRLLAARRPLDLVYVVQAPPPKGLELLASGAAAPGYRGALRSATTRMTGLTAATDIAPTVLERLGLAVPKKMQGEVIESRAGHGAAYVRDLGERLDAILPHRSAALRTVVPAWLVLIAAMALLRRGEGVRFAARVVFLERALAAGADARHRCPPAELDRRGAAARLGALGAGGGERPLLPWPAAPADPGRGVRWPPSRSIWRSARTSPRCRSPGPTPRGARASSASATSSR